MKILQKVSRRTKIMFLAFFLALGTFSAVQMSNPTMIYAEENENTEEVPDLEYNENGWMEKFVIGLFDVNVTIFGQDINFNDLGGSMDQFLDFEQMKNNDFSADGGTFNIYSFFKDIVYPAVKGMGISLLTMMMMWKFIKECLEVERFSWERAMMLIARTLIIDMFINNSFEILEIFFSWVMDLFSTIVQSIGSPGSGANAQHLGIVFAAGITEVSMVEKVVFFIAGFIMALFYYGTCITVISQVLVRYVKILCAMAFAPLPMALSVDEQHGTDVLRYVFWMVGCFLQAPIIKVCFYIYSLLLTEAGTQISALNSFNAGTVIPLCLLISIITGLLAMMINMAQQVTDRIMPA